HLK
ncbi:hypothetical protein VCHENC02_1345B, partial [Vibrio harveyi]